MHKIIIIFMLCVSFNPAFAQFRTVSGYGETSSYKEPGDIDTKLFRSINSIKSSFLDNAVSLNDKSLMGASVIAPVALFTASRLNGNTYDENSAVLMSASEFTSLAVTQSMKYLIQRDRPYRELKNVYYNADNSYTDKYGFPSGHTALSFSMSTSLAIRYSDDPLFVMGLYAYSTTISLGRIYLGVHYPSDVLAGMLIGTGSAILVNAFSKDIIKLKNNVINEHKEDRKEGKSLSAPVVFGSIIATDILNYFLSSSGNKNLNKTNLSVNSTGISNNLTFIYNF